ncbi:MAG: glycosyltransferase family 4 protein [Candidatus Saccharimonadales bacterium]|jgi:glycogen(starch) synthase
MKVLMLGWELPPHHTGGMGVVCYQMCKELAHSGADIEFILPYTADFPNIPFMTINPALPEGVQKVIGMTAGSTYDSQYFEYVGSEGSTRGVQMDEHQSQYARYVAKLAKINEYDIIHAHDWLTFRAALAAKQVSGKPLFVHIHATEYDRSGGGRGNPLVREIEYMGLQLADKVFAISQATKDTIIREYDIDPDKIEVVHNAMELEEHELQEDTSANTFKYLQAMQAAGYRVVLSAGRLTIQKGLTNLLDAFALVVSRQPKSLLLIVGSGEQYTELIEMSAELGIGGNVIFTGRLDGTGKTWRDAFRVANLFVMPSVSEPFGLTPFEALHQHTPSLISKQSGASELLKNVLKVDFWDTNEMANQILGVLKNADLEHTLATEGNAELSRVTWKNSVQKMLQQYNYHSNRHRSYAYGR